MNKDSVTSENNTYSQTSTAFHSVQEKIDYLEDKASLDSTLGSVYTKEKTSFAIWAPLAEKVSVNIYSSGDINDDSLEQQVNLALHQTIWSGEILGDLENKYYTYTIVTNGDEAETNDIYAKAVGINGDRAAIIDLETTNPKGWENDHHVMQKNLTDAVIWETHVADFSSDPNGGFSKENQGKYLAFTEDKTTYRNEGQYPTGIQYLTALGVNYIHLLPVYDFDNDEEGSEYNWGYDPKNYNVPEGRYSSDPKDPKNRITELKQAVQTLHERNIGVVMDVVYNHTQLTETSWFNLTVPEYYYRQSESGGFANGSGCGNETASERKMMRRFMIDSILYWTKEYHIDGFRFDLMGLHDVHTMNYIRQALDDEGYEDIILYGEPWDAGSNQIYWPNIPANMGNVEELSTGIGVFNSDFRDTVKGSVFGKTDGAFVQGMNGNGWYDADLMTSIRGSISTWANTPNQSVAYVSAHDNLTLYDKLTASMLPKSSLSQYKRHESVIQANKQAAVLLFTSQGAVFMQAGEEFGRSKYGDENSYSSPIETNQIDWSLVKTNEDLASFYQGLIKIRQNYPPLRDSSIESAETILFSQDQVENLMAFTIPNHFAKTGDWKTMAVVLNSTETAQRITLEGDNLPAKWTIIADDQQAGLISIGEIEGNDLSLDAKQFYILVA
ncbi:MAG: type I pullulanase [Pisciglobus halotolerans]|nr:type I pullulanase [Pisciglobus halotolerans]